MSEGSDTSLQTAHSNALPAQRALQPVHSEVLPAERALALPPAVLEPEEMLEAAAKVARVLHKMVKKTNGSIRLGAHDHLKNESWLTLAGFFTTTPRIVDTQYVEYGPHHGFRAIAELVDRKTQQVISRAEACCLNDEPNWDERAVYEWKDGTKKQIGTEKVALYALMSMAETRASSKVCSLAYRWIAVLAGYSGTPSDEMPKGTAEDNPVKCPACGKTGTIIKEKPEYGQGWVCWKKAKAGGCGAKFDTDPSGPAKGKSEEQVAVEQDAAFLEARPEYDPKRADGLFKSICNSLGGGTNQRDFAKNLSAHLARSMNLTSIDALKDVPEGDRLKNLQIVAERGPEAKAWVETNARLFREQHPEPESLIPVKAAADYRAAAKAAGRESPFIDATLVLLHGDLVARRKAGASGRELIGYAEESVKREIGKLKPASQPQFNVPAPADLGVQQTDVPTGSGYQATDDDVPF